MIACVGCLLLKSFRVLICCVGVLLLICFGWLLFSFGVYFVWDFVWSVYGCLALLWCYYFSCFRIVVYVDLGCFN